MACVPMAPPAPVRFSTTNCCLKVALRCSATTRASVSPLPPAPNGTMTLIGRSGQPCALPGPMATPRMLARRTRPVVSLRMMPLIYVCAPARSTRPWPMFESDLGPTAAARQGRREGRAAACRSDHLQAGENHATGGIAAVDRFQAVGQRIFADQRADADLGVLGAVEIIDAANRKLVDHEHVSIESGHVLVQFGFGDA